MERKFIKKIEKHIPKHLPIPTPTSSFRLNIYAPSFSGKSYLINDMLTNPKYGYKKVFSPERIFIMSPTYESDTSYEGLKKYMKDYEDTNITDRFDEDMILEILEFQKAKKKQKKMRPVLLLVDDLVTSVNAKRQNEMTNLYLRGRHWGVNLILTSQKYKYVPSGMRLNADCNIFFSNNMNRKELNDISEECPDDVFLDLCEDLKKNNYFQYDFIYQNVKHPFSKRYYRGFNKQFKLENK